MTLFVPDTDETGKTVYRHNSKVEYVTFCECGEYGTRSQYGRDEICAKCGKPFDWTKEQKW